MVACLHVTPQGAQRRAAHSLSQPLTNPTMPRQYSKLIGAAVASSAARKLYGNAKYAYSQFGKRGSSTRAPVYNRPMARSPLIKYHRHLANASTGGPGYYDIGIPTLSQGDSDTTRQGNRVYIQGIKVNLTIGPIGNLGTPGDAVRVIVYIPKNPADELHNDMTDNVFSAAEHEKYTVLYDTMYVHSPERTKICINKSFGSGRMLKFDGTGSTDWLTSPIRIMIASENGYYGAKGNWTTVFTDA